MTTPTTHTRTPPPSEYKVIRVDGSTAANLITPDTVATGASFEEHLEAARKDGFTLQTAYVNGTVNVGILVKY